MINPTPLVWEILPSLQHQPDCLLWWRWRQVDISHTGGVKSCGHHMLIFHQLIHLFRSKTHGQHPRINCTFTASFNSGQFVVSEQQHGEKLQCHSPDQPATHTTKLNLIGWECQAVLRNNVSVSQKKHGNKHKCSSPLSNFHVYDKKDDTEHNADWADDEITNSKKRILSTKPWRRCQYHSLSSIEWWHWIRCTQKKHNIW